MTFLRRASPQTLTAAPNEAEAISSASEYSRLRDPVGHQVQASLAAVYLLLLPLGTSPKDFAWGLLAAWSVVRLASIWRCYLALRRDPVLWLLAAWAAWHGLSILWSADRAGGLDELGAFRVILTPLFLWPVLDRAAWLIGAFLVGVFCMNAGQLTQQLEWFGMGPAANGRLEGWLHAIHTGALCVAALCWHTSALMHRVGRRPAWMALTLLGVIAASGGLVFSGSRGPWLAAAAALPLCVVTIAARRPATRRAALIVAAAGIVGAAAAWPFAGDYVKLRAGQAVEEVRAAWGETADYDSDTGKRLARWSAAWEVFRERPLAGSGAGGYGLAAGRLGYDAQLVRADHHAHSVYLHELATTGFAGGIIVLAVVVLCVVRALSLAPAHPYADGTLFVLASWLIGAQFDCYQLNGTMFGLLTVVVALTLPARAAGSSRRP